MIMCSREYAYVGPPELQHLALTQCPGSRILTLEDLRAWLATAEADQLPDGSHIATFTIDIDGDLLLAPRRSEHVACAAGGPVLSAGEIVFDKELTVTEVSNQSTGFCPEPESWDAVAVALERIGVRHPAQFITVAVFRLCLTCGQRNIVKDNWYYCNFCDAELPRDWNFSRNATMGP
jgi:hypothetical protein